MIVLDASAAVDWLLQTPAGESIEKRIYSRHETLHAPDFLDLEVTQVLRRLALQGVVPARRADEAVHDLLDLRITRYPHLVLLPRIWQLRHNLSTYRCRLHCARRKARSCISYTGWSTRRCFEPYRSYRALLAALYLVDSLRLANSWCRPNLTPEPRRPWRLSGQIYESILEGAGDGVSAHHLVHLRIIW